MEKQLTAGGIFGPTVIEASLGIGRDDMRWAELGGYSAQPAARCFVCREPMPNPGNYYPDPCPGGEPLRVVATGRFANGYFTGQLLGWAHRSCFEILPNAAPYQTAEEWRQAPAER